jgi:uncharacterized protein YggL (DUF469 family)
VNRRLRKKLRRGEFAWRKFGIQVWMLEPFRGQACEPLFDRFGVFLDGIGLVCFWADLGDPWNLIIDGIVPTSHWLNSRNKRWVNRHCTETDRDLVGRFLELAPEVDRFEVGELVA